MYTTTSSLLYKSHCARETSPAYSTIRKKLYSHAFKTGLLHEFGIFFVKSKFNKWKISRNPNPKYKKIGAMQQLWQEYHFFRLDSMYSSRLNFRDQTKWGIEPSLNAVYTIGIFCGKAIIIGAKSSRKTKLWT